MPVSTEYPCAPGDDCFQARLSSVHARHQHADPIYRQGFYFAALQPAGARRTAERGVGREFFTLGEMARSSHQQARGVGNGERGVPLTAPCGVEQQRQRFLHVLAAVQASLSGRRTIGLGKTEVAL